MTGRNDIFKFKNIPEISNMVTVFIKGHEVENQTAEGLAGLGNGLEIKSEQTDSEEMIVNIENEDIDTNNVDNGGKDGQVDFGRGLVGFNFGAAVVEEIESFGEFIEEIGNGVIDFKFRDVIFGPQLVI